MIKQRILTLVLALSLSASYANEGISFFKGSWTELLAAATQQGKLIFVDVYTDWCPPCKQMDKYVLPSPEVGNKYNAAFISYKLDAEKGEGVAIANKYSVKAYPTYLYLDPQGYLLHRAEGYFAPAPFIQQAERALSLGSADNPISFLEKEFKEGNRNPSFLRNYIQKMSSLKLDNTAALNAYFTAMPAQELAKPSELVFLGNQISSIGFQGLPFLLEHYPSLKKEQQKELATRLHTKVLYNAAGVAWKEGRVIEMQQLITYINRLRSDIAPAHYAGIDKLNLFYYGLTRNHAQLKKTGYAIVKPLLAVSNDSLRAEDKRQYQKLMRPFLTGEMDSTKVIGFEEEKQFALHIYSSEISNKLYEVATAFAGVLDGGDSGLADALKWINRAAEINPGNEAIKKLAMELEERVDPKATPEVRIGDGKN